MIPNFEGVSFRPTRSYFFFFSFFNKKGLHLFPTSSFVSEQYERKKNKEEELHTITTTSTKSTKRVKRNQVTSSQHGCHGGLRRGGINRIKSIRNACIWRGNIPSYPISQPRNKTIYVGSVVQPFFEAPAGTAKSNEGEKGDGKKTRKIGFTNAMCVSECDLVSCGRGTTFGKTEKPEAMPPTHILAGVKCGVWYRE